LCQADVAGSPTRTIEFLGGPDSAGASRRADDDSDDDSLGGNDDAGGDFGYGDDDDEERVGDSLAGLSSRRSSGASSLMGQSPVESDDEGETEEERDLGVDNDNSDDGGTSEAGDANNASGVVTDDAGDNDAAVVSEYDDDVSRGRDHAGDDDDTGGRRSRRNRYPPLAYWKNERFVYERPQSGVGEVLPVVAGVSERSKTPQAKAARPVPGANRGRKRAAETAPLDPKELPRGIVVKRNDKGRVWHDGARAPRKMRVVCRNTTMVADEQVIPSPANRGGIAARGFYTGPVSAVMPGWISGYILLPPKALKESETVGDCTQVFFVGDCQSQGLEIAIGLPAKRKEQQAKFEDSTAQRFLLNPGDQFFVPPHNTYSLINHSNLVEAKVTWIIIKVRTISCNNKRSRMCDSENESTSQCDSYIVVTHRCDFFYVQSLFVVLVAGGRATEGGRRFQR